MTSLVGEEIVGHASVQCNKPSLVDATLGHPRAHDPRHFIGQCHPHQHGGFTAKHLAQPAARAWADMHVPFAEGIGHWRQCCKSRGDQRSDAGDHDQASGL